MPDASPVIDICASGGWENVPGAVDTAIAAARAAVAAAGDGRQVELSLALVPDAQVRELNRTFRGQDKATNVLSFPAARMPQGETETVFLGDVIIAYETVLNEARDAEKSLSDHLSHLTVHGVLHLFGYDHETNDEAEHMEDLERTILRSLGVSDPYGPAMAGAV